jgi:hypothetical protein
LGVLSMIVKPKVLGISLALILAACGGGGGGGNGGGGGLPPTPTPTPSATPSVPATISRYMATTDPSVLHTEGCQMAQGASGQAQSGVVVLDYGEPYDDGAGTYGTSDYGTGNPFVSAATIQTAVEGYLDGYASCNVPATNHLILAVGTSNFGSHVSVAHAQAWATMVASLGAYITTKTYPNETIAAADDMETGWSSAAVTRAWLDAYVAQTNTIPLYDYGDAGGCPSTTYGAGGVCQPGWTQADVGYVAGAAGPNVRAIPEIYNTSGTTANQWTQIALGMIAANTPVTFAAVMTQDGSCGTGCSGLNNTPAQALGLLNADFAANAATRSIVVTSATDITTAN